MPFPFLAAAGIAAPLVQNFIQNRMNKNMANYTYRKDLDMWNKANEYNSPKNQMTRYGQAGLNRNLIYAQGSSGNTTASMPKYTPPERKFQTPDAMNIITQYQDLKNKMAQEDLLKAQIDNTKNESFNKSLMPAILKLRPELMQGQYSNLIQDIQNKQANERYTNFNLQKGQTLLPYQLQAQQLANAKSEKQIDYILSRIGVSNLEKSWMQKKYDTMIETGVNIDKDAVWMRLLADVFGKQINDVKQFNPLNKKYDVTSPLKYGYKKAKEIDWTAPFKAPIRMYNYIKKH